MENWRTYFGRAGADIWTIIEQAVILAATDYPKEFKEKRSDIAETLFARRLLQLHSGETDVTRLSGSVVTHATNLMEENEVRKDTQEAGHTRELSNVEQDRHCCSYDEAEALNAEMEEENLLMKDLCCIKDTIMEPGQSEMALLDALQRLEYLQITVEALKATEIGKQVNSLRKHSSKRVRFLVKHLVRGWKDLVDEWVKSAGDVAAASIAGPGGCETSAAENVEQGLPSPPLDEGALLAARTTTSLEMSQFFSFMDDDMAAGTVDAIGKEECCHSTEPSINDNLHYPTASQSRSMQTDLSDYDGKASTSYSDQRLRVSEERGSSSRVECAGVGRTQWRLESGFRGSTREHCKDQKEFEQTVRLLVRKTDVDSCGPGRPAIDALKMRSNATAVGSGPGRPVSEASKMKRHIDLQRTVEVNMDRNLKSFPSNQKSVSDETQVAQKLEITKRKLHEGYQQAENAKKQRTVQLVDLPDLPKGGYNQEKQTSLTQTKPGSQNWRLQQNRKQEQGRQSGRSINL